MCGSKGMSKAPKLHAGGMQSAMNKVPSAQDGRSGWQKVRSVRMAIREEAALRTNVPDTSHGSSEAAMAAGWLKQRIATELLGDNLTAPWEIDDTVLFERLASLIGSTSMGGMATPADSVEGGSVEGGSVEEEAP